MASIRISKGFGDDEIFVGECQSQTRIWVCEWVLLDDGWGFYDLGHARVGLCNLHLKNNLMILCLVLKVLFMVIGMLFDCCICWQFLFV